MILAHGPLRADRIYVIALDGDLMAKRLRRDRVKHEIAAHSGDSRYPDPQHVPMDADPLRIEGKAVGWFHRHPY